jgi:hypothetical protein
MVDDSEFASFISQANGSLQGGIMMGLGQGQNYSGSSLPSSGNLGSINRDFNGNLILVGTTANPLVIDGTIAVNGDVIIQGVVKGSGQIITRGSVYVTGDVTYADGTSSGNRTFGVASDGSQNALALTAGGNVLVGDYLTPKNGNIMSPTSIDAGNGTTGFSFTMSEVTLFNRLEWTKTQQLLRDRNGNLVTNSTYVSGYRPRYYTMGPSDPIYIFNHGDTYWDPVAEAWQGREHVDSYDMSRLTAINPGEPGYINATVLNLAPSAGWVSETQLKQFWIADESARPAGQSFKLDGLYYTNNALFTLARNASKSNGQMVVNGSLIASDVGVLVPGGSSGVGLRLYYDSRLKQWLNVPDFSKVEYYRVDWAQK